MKNEYSDSLWQLFLTFLILKLCHVIDWSWWYVSMPMWLPATIVLVSAVFIGLFDGSKKQDTPTYDNSRKSKFHQALENAINNKKNQN